MARKKPPQPTVLQPTLLPGEAVDLSEPAEGLAARQRREAAAARAREYRLARRARKAAGSAGSERPTERKAPEPASGPLRLTPEELALLQRNVEVRENIAMRQQVLLGPALQRLRAFEDELAEKVKARLGIDSADFDADPQTGVLTPRS
jgi:hypothetical protein